MRRGFVNGLIAGGVIGALMGMFLVSRVQPETRQRITDMGHRVGRTTGRLWRRTRDMAEDTVGDRMK